MTDATTVNPPITSASTTGDARAIDAELKHQPPKRQKTWGERIFNWRTYGGIALMGNEAASLVITESVKPDKRFHAPYKKLESWFAKFSNPESESSLRQYIAGNGKQLLEGRSFAPRLPYLLLATVGGMLMVPFVKFAEDHKGDQVRKLDRGHYGAMSDRDQKLVEAHKEMDEAPKQTWGSLWKGRFSTVVSAAVADFTFGWDHALSTRIFKNPELSLNGLSRWTANSSIKLFNVAPGKQQTFRKVAENGTWLLALSSTLTVLFYASSKLFAKRQEQKIERQQEQRAFPGGSNAENADNALAATATNAPSEKMPSDKPTPQVMNIRREETLATVPQLSQGA